MSQENYRFNKPVIILAAPRSGSTLLFELLSKSKNTWTIGDESHEIFESISQLNPQSGLCNSNRLEAVDASEKNIEIIRRRFYTQIRDRNGLKYSDALDKPRLLEKTPKNSLRVPFLNKIFPDAFYIYLYRNPRDNVSSIMDAWKSQRFVTYPALNGRNGSWSLLLPPDWEKMNNKPLEDIAYFQWEATNSIIMDDLQSLIPKERWRVISYSNIIDNTEDVIKELCDFSGLEFDDVLQKTCRSELKMSRYTLSVPSSNKWHANAAVLSRVLPSAKHVLNKLKKVASKPLEKDFDIHIPQSLCKQHNPTNIIDGSISDLNIERVGRNSPCPCGSGLKYKVCHGKI